MLPILVFAAAFAATSLALFAPELRASAATQAPSPAPPASVQALAAPPGTARRVPAAPRFRGCNAARAAGRENIPRGDSDYRIEMDGDGLACEPLTYATPGPYVPRRVRVIH